MPYYLAPFVGDGSGENPFVAVGSDQPGFSIIDLRPDPTVATGGALLHLPQAIIPIPSGLIKLSELPDDFLSSLITGRLGNALGLTILAGRFKDIVSEVLVSPPIGKWNKLQPSIERGRYEIWLGGLLWSMPVIAGGASYSDNFNRANETPLAAPWSLPSGTTNLSANTTKAQSTGGIISSARYDNDLTGADHDAQATVKVITTGGTKVGGPAGRFASAAITYYAAQIRKELSQVRFVKVITGALTVIATAAFTVALGTPYVVKLRLDGSTYTVWVDDTQYLTGTDTSITGGVRGGMSAMVSVADSVEIDDWSVADLVGAAAARSDAVMRGVCAGVLRGAR